VQGKPLDDARTALETFYKHDEAFAFDLWASPRSRPACSCSTPKPPQAALDLGRVEGRRGAAEA